MKAGYFLGINKHNKIVYSKEFFMMEEFMEKFDIEESSNVMFFEDPSITDYFAKYFELNSPDFSVSLRENIYQKQNKIIDNYNKNIAICKETIQQELFKTIEEKKIDIIKDVSIKKEQETLIKIINDGKVINNHEQFLLAGKALFTIKNELTGNRFTFKVTKTKNRNRNLDEKCNYYFVNVLSGKNNENNYSYMGMLKVKENNKEFYLTEKSKFSKDVICVKVFVWLLKNINNLPKEISFYHEGRCAKCGRILTVPESIKSGFGPECQKQRRRKFRGILK